MPNYIYEKWYEWKVHDAMRQWDNMKPSLGDR